MREEVMSIKEGPLVSVRSRSAIANLGGVLGLAGVVLLTGGTTPVLAQSGEFSDVILLDDVPGFVGDQDADTILACLPDGTCVTANGNVLAGFRPAVWPNLRLVDDDLVIESDVQVQATAFGRIIAREGFIAETFASGPGHPIDSVNSSPSGAEAVAITPHPLWAANNFEGSAAVWISYADTGIDGPPPAATEGTTFTVSESFFVPPGTTADIDGFVFADDTAEVVLVENGTRTTVFDFNDVQGGACADGPIGCEETDKGDLNQGNVNLDALPPGDYTLEFTARQDSNDPIPANNPFGLMYAFDVTLDLLTVADFCWTFDGGIPGEKVCVSIAECDDCVSPPGQCPVDGDSKITLTSGPDGDAICNDIAGQFVDKGATESLEEFQFIVGLDVPDTSEPGTVRVATCTITEPVEEQATYVPLCRNPASKVVEAIVNNDIPVFAFETPRCVKMGGRTYC
jgi:hypothetical protein